MKAALAVIILVIVGGIATAVTKGSQEPVNVPFGNGIRGIVKEEGFAMGGRRAVGIVEGDDVEMVKSSTVETGWFMGLFQRQHRTRLHLILDGSDEDGFFKVDPRFQYAFDFTISGHANLAVHIGLYAADGSLIGYDQIVDMNVGGGNPWREYGQRFILPPDITLIRPAFWLAGTNTLTIEAASITRLDVPVPGL